VLLIALAVGTLFAVGPAAADNSITSKRAQAEAILAKVQALNSNMEKTVEAYDLANIQLAKINDELRSNQKNLTAARNSLGKAQRTIALRLRDLYMNGNGDSTLEVLLGANSLDDIITRLDAIQRVSGQDAKVLGAVTRYRKQVEVQRGRLNDARARQTQIVAQRAAEKRSIESQLAQQNRMLASVKDEIARLQAEERRRQAELAAQARARLAAQQRLAALQAQNAVTVPAFDPGSVATVDPSTVPAAQYGSVVSIALQYLGIPYVWGGASPATGFDCSGFVMYVFAQVGVYLPHNAAAQWAYGVSVSRDQLAPGDLVFFEGLGHVGIYIGNDEFVHAPHTGDVVKISSLDEAWYASTYVGARRL
jgi:cell wall-associated NlpC family hydrolase